MTCERCAKMEARKALRGHYIRECSFPEPVTGTEQAYGPFCSRDCAWRAVFCGAIRTRVYIQPFVKAKEAPLYMRGALPPSKAPQREDSDYNRLKAMGVST